MEAANTAQAVEELKRKQDRRARWAKIGSGVFAAAILLKAAVFFLAPAEVLACDNSEGQTALTELINKAVTEEKGTARVASITGVQTVSRDDKIARCSAHVTMTDQSAGTLTYHLDTKKVMIDSLQ